MSGDPERLASEMARLAELAAEAGREAPPDAGEFEEQLAFLTRHVRPALGAQPAR